MDLGTMLLVYFGWLLIPIMAFVISKGKQKKFPIEAVIFEKRSNNIIKTNDRIGRVYNKELGQTVYKFMKSKDVIDVLPFDSIVHNKVVTASVPEWLMNKIRPNEGTVFLFKYGSKQYKPLKSVEGDVSQSLEEVKDKKGNSVMVNIYQPFDPRNELAALKFQVIDWDDVNTTMNEIRNSNERRKTKSEFWLKFLVPIAIIATTGIICVILLYLTYDADMSFCTSNQQPAASNTNPNIPVISDLIPSGSDTPPQ